MRKSRGAVCIVCGNLAAALGVALGSAAGMGVDPVSALYDGVHRVFELEMGTASFLVNIGILIICASLNRKYLKWGTFLSMLSFAGFLNISVRLLSSFHPEPYSPGSFIVFLTGMLLAGAGFATVVFPEMGPNCADILLEVLKDMAGIPMQYGKMSVDVCCTVLGFFMGGAVGLGTILCVLAMGPIYSRVSWIWNLRKSAYSPGG